MDGYILYGVGFLLNIFLIYRAQVCFNYSLHRDYTLVTPNVERLDKMQWVFSFLISLSSFSGLLIILIIFFMEIIYNKLTLTQALFSVKTGKKYF